MRNPVYCSINLQGTTFINSFNLVRYWQFFLRGIFKVHSLPVLIFYSFYKIEIIELIVTFLTSTKIFWEGITKQNILFPTRLLFLANSLRSIFQSKYKLLAHVVQAIWTAQTWVTSSTWESSRHATCFIFLQSQNSTWAKNILEYIAYITLV